MANDVLREDPHYPLVETAICEKEEPDEDVTTGSADSNPHEESGYDSFLREQVARDLECSDDEESNAGEAGEDVAVTAETQSNPDDYWYCDKCKDWVLDGCLDHEINFADDLSHHPLALPDGLQLSADGNAVLANRSFPSGTVFGPLQAASVVDFPAKSIRECDYLWEVRHFDGQSSYLLYDGKRHWMQMVGFDTESEEQNLMALQFKGLIYYKSIRSIRIGEQLKVHRGEGLGWTKGIDINTLIRGKGNRKLSKRGRYPCEDCPAVFDNVKKHRAHRGRRHKPKDDVRCRFCTYVGKSHTTLINHMSYKHNHKKEKPTLTMICDICSKVYNKRQKLVEHIQGHRHECKFCLRRFKSPEKRQLHMRIKHAVGTSSMPKKYSCQSCGFKMHTEQQLEWHMEWHRMSGAASVEQRSVEDNSGMSDSESASCSSVSGESCSSSASAFKCASCPKHYLSAGALSRHMWQKHPHLKQQEATTKMLKRMDPSQNTHLCDICPKGFKSNIDLMYHKMRHTGNFPFKCPICQGGYVTQSELTKHIKRSRCSAVESM